MTDYVWYPVSGDGQSPATAYTWNAAAAVWNTGSWIVADALIFGDPNIVPGDVPGSGVGTSGGPGLDSVGLIAGEIDATTVALYNAFGADPAHGDPYIGSNDYKVDLLINTGTVELANLLMAAANTLATPGLEEFPTIDVEGATFKVDGSIIDTFTAGFPVAGTQTATGGGTIDIGSGATVQVAGSVHADIVMDFKDAAHDLLTLGGVSVSQPGEFAGTIDGFALGDTIDLTGVPFAVDNTETFDVIGNNLTISSGTTTIATLHINGLYTTASFHLQDDGSGKTAIVAPCFVEGTRIATERGPVAVEALRTGDRVPVVTGGKAQPITWLGHRRVDCRHHPEPEAVWPVCLSAGAFGPGRPFRDLWLSPDHALLIGGVLIPIRYLVNGRTIHQEPRDEVTYWHVELAEHSVLYAEGVPAESYLDTGNRGAFANGGPAMDLHPDFSRQVWEAKGCAPLVMDGPKLAAAKRRLLVRASALGHVTTDDPDLTVRVNSRTLRATRNGRIWRVRLPKTARNVRLRSRVWLPAHLQPDNDDLRTLGVAISRLWLDGCAVELDNPVLSSGWHAREAEWRWTDGDALLAVSGAHELCFEVATLGTYWRQAEYGAVRAA